MVAVTYGAARAAAGALKAKSKAKKGSGFFARLMNAMMEARLRQAQREIFLHQHLVQDWDAFELSATKKTARRR